MREIPYAAIRDAAASIYNVAVRTPLIRLPLSGDAQNRLGGTEIYLKLEALQPIGSFKIRGAWNVIRQLRPEDLRDGVWTVSAGNAAQGVALAANMAGVPCSVMVMDTAPQTKLRAIERLGATIVPAPYDECWKTVETHRSDRMRGHFVHPFDDDRFIAGNATAGVEIIEDLPDVDAVVAPIGGGGLIAGVAAAIKLSKPNARVIGVEPEGAPGMSESLRRGEAVRLDRVDTIADGLAAPFAGRLNYLHVRELVDEMALVTDAEIAAAMPVLIERCKIVPEPAAAAATAALLTGKIKPARGSTTVAVVSGGNVDRSRLVEILSR